MAVNRPPAFARWARSPHIILSKMVDDHGPVFTIRLGMRRALIVNNWEAAKECFTTNDAAFSNRSKSIALQHMTYDFAMLGFTEYGSYWRENRKICSQKLLSHQRLALLGCSRMDEMCTAMMVSLYRSCTDRNGGMGLTPLDLKKLLGEVTAGLMVRVVGGERAWERMEERDSEKWLRATEEFFRLMAGVNVPDLIPFLKWLDYFDGINEKFRKAEQKFDGMIHAWLDGVKQGKKMGGSEDEGGFMAEIMTSTDRVAREFPRYDADTINKATCRGHGKPSTAHEDRSNNHTAENEVHPASTQEQEAENESLLDIHLSQVIHPPIRVDQEEPIVSEPVPNEAPLYSITDEPTLPGPSMYEQLSMGNSGQKSGRKRQLFRVEEIQRAAKEVIKRGKKGKQSSRLKLRVPPSLTDEDILLTQQSVSGPMTTKNIVMDGGKKFLSLC